MVVKPLSIVHLSDLHFGRTSEHVLKDLKTFLETNKETINLTILTGDLTQRAKSHEFKEAKNFLTDLPAPLFLVPGNHDVPLYNLFLRFFRPYKKFLKYMGPFSENYYEDDQVAVYGLWTPHHFSIKSGKIRTRDLIEVQDKFRQVPETKIKILASHHPLLDLSSLHIKPDVQSLIELNPHFILWGHEHQSQLRELKPGSLPLFVASGTSASNRTRHEVNSFNLIKVIGSQIEVTIYHHTEKGFVPFSLKNYSLPS